jgi:hypothetical protein
VDLISTHFYLFEETMKFLSIDVGMVAVGYGCSPEDRQLALVNYDGKVEYFCTILGKTCS